MNDFFQKYRLFDQTLKGVGQIMLQENRWTGLFFLAGLFAGSWQVGVAALIASATGALTARLLKFDPDEIDAGLYGFSPALVGVAMLFLYQGTVWVWLLAIVGSVLAVIIQHLFFRIKFPAYTFPFILVAWIFVFFIRLGGDFVPSDLIQIPFRSTSLDAFFAITNGFGEVIFQAKPISGFLFFLGVMINSPVTALYAALASTMGAYLAMGQGQEHEQIMMGLFGFNAVLTAIVFAGKTYRDFIWVFIGVIITVFLHLGLVNSGWLLPVGGVFTFPFVAGTWVTLLLQRIFRRKKSVV